jgi:glycine oxidase
MPQRLELFPPLQTTAVGTPPWQRPGSLPPTLLPARSEVVVVGAGITGLSVALTCAHAGRAVVVLERGFGAGATARSGGIVLGETVEGPDPEFDGCEETLRQWIQSSHGECDLRWAGCLELARDSRLPPGPIQWTDEGSIRLANRIAGGVLDPAKLQTMLFEAARKAGATIVDGVTVLNADRCTGGIRMSTDRGVLTAGFGVMAVDAMCWRRGFDPWRQRVMTVSLQTASVSVSDLAGLGLQPDEAFYSIDAPLLWGRVMPDRSLLVGRETGPFPQSAGHEELGIGLTLAGRRLSARVRGLHPVLSEIAIPRVWTGPLARTTAGHPTITVDPFVPQLLWAGGYGGQGIAQGFRLGRRAGERILGVS